MMMVLQSFWLAEVPSIPVDNHWHQAWALNNWTQRLPFHDFRGSTGNWVEKSYCPDNTLRLEMAMAWISSAGFAAFGHKVLDEIVMMMAAEKYGLILLPFHC